MNKTEIIKIKLEKGRPKQTNVKPDEAPSLTMDQLKSRMTEFLSAKGKWLLPHNCVVTIINQNKAERELNNIQVTKI